MKVLVDTSVVVDYLRTGFGLDSEVEWFISTISVGELFGGESAQVGGKQREVLDMVLGGMEVLPLGYDSAKLAGKLKYDHQMSLADALIVATALNVDLRLATLNRKHFDKISNLKFYGVEGKRKGE